MRKTLKLTEDVECRVERVETFVIERKMCDAEIRVFILVILVFAYHNRGIIPKSVAAHQRKVVLKRATAYRIASSLKFC